MGRPFICYLPYHDLFLTFRHKMTFNNEVDQKNFLQVFRKISFFDQKALLESAFKKIFFQGKKMQFKKSDFNKRCKNEIEDNNENEFYGSWSSKRPPASLGVQVNKLFLVTRNSSPPMSELVKYLNMVFSRFDDFFAPLEKNLKNRADYDDSKFHNLETEKCKTIM